MDNVLIWITFSTLLKESRFWKIVPNPMEAFTKEKLRSVNVPEAALLDGFWTTRIPALTALSPSGGRRANGAARVAAFIVDILGQ